MALGRRRIGGRCGVSRHGRDLRRDSKEHLAAAFDRIREARDRRHPAVDAKTAAWVTLALGDSKLDSDTAAAAGNVIEVLAFAETGRGGLTG